MLVSHPSLFKSALGENLNPAQRIRVEGFDHMTTAGARQVCPELASLLIYAILELLLHNLLDRFFPAACLTSLGPLPFRQQTGRASPARQRRKAIQRQQKAADVLDKVNNSIAAARRQSHTVKSGHVLFDSKYSRSVARQVILCEARVCDGYINLSLDN
jgi:hypothetical protein